MTGRGLAAAGLLAAAAAGGVAALQAPRRFGGHGRLAVSSGMAVLFLRDAAMIADGAPGRLKKLPRALLYLELTAAGASLLFGVAALCSESAASADRRPIWASAGFLGGTAEKASTITFAIHTLRQAIYLTPGQGRLEPRQGSSQDLAERQ